jgi:hypothetical protein
MLGPKKSKIFAIKQPGNQATRQSSNQATRHEATRRLDQRDI